MSLNDQEKNDRDLSRCTHPFVPWIRVTTSFGEFTAMLTLKSARTGMPEPRFGKSIDQLEWMSMPLLDLVMAATMFVGGLFAFLGCLKSNIIALWNKQINDHIGQRNGWDEHTIPKDKGLSLTIHLHQDLDLACDDFHPPLDFTESIRMIERQTNTNNR